MRNFAEASERCQRALSSLLKLAENRNYKLDEQGIVWCPVSVNTEAPKLAGEMGASFRSFLLHLYFPAGPEVELPMALSIEAARIIDFPDNDWMRNEFTRYAETRYREVYLKAPAECYPDELAFFDIYHHGEKGKAGAMDGKQLLHALATFDYFRIWPQSADKYFFIPTSAPKLNSRSRIPVPRSGASAATHRVDRNEKWDSPSLRPIWTRMRKAIERVQVIPDDCLPEWRSRGIFTADGRINADLPQWTIVGGNHDSFVTDVKPIRRGINDAIFVEHGHLRDDKNSPEAMLSGIFFTGLNAAFELKGVGDEAKAVEFNRRERFLKNAADVNLNPDYPYRKSKGPGPDFYSVVVTGHTHRKYAALLKEHPALPLQFETVSVFHEDAWPGMKVAPRLLTRGLGDVVADSSVGGWLFGRLSRALANFAKRRNE